MMAKKTLTNASKTNSGIPSIWQNKMHAKLWETILNKSNAIMRTQVMQITISECQTGDCIIQFHKSLNQQGICFNIFFKN